MDEADEIVVFRQYTSSIDASIAKAKLDAYGIPCFLSEENMTGLYPGQQALPFSVRLHVFRKDLEAAAKLFMEAQPKNGAADVVCPRCHSYRIEREFPKTMADQPLMALKILFFGVFMPGKKVNHCLDCDNEF